MHQTRARASTRIPIPRRGTKYLARALHHPRMSVTVLTAIRDMLGFARTAREVKQLIHEKKITLNGKLVRDYHEPIILFSILGAGNHYKLTLLSTGKFTLEETKDKERLVKVIGKRKVAGGKIQVAFHDGTTALSNDTLNVGDSVYLDMENKIKKRVQLEKGKEVTMISGKSAGLHGKINHVQGTHVEVTIGGKVALLQKKSLIVR